MTILMNQNNETLKKFVDVDTFKTKLHEALKRSSIFPRCKLFSESLRITSYNEVFDDDLRKDLFEVNAVVDGYYITEDDYCRSNSRSIKMKIEYSVSIEFEVWSTPTQGNRSTFRIRNHIKKEV